MNKLVSMKFGSHLYGTATPASDLDLKSVHLPDPAELLLGRVKAVVSTSTGDPNAKNTAEDVDDESFTLQKFLALAAQGQTVAVDMLFAPDWSWMGAPDRLWLEVVENRHRLLTSQSASFVGYCRTQANKYGIRGSRVAAARAALDLLGSARSDLKLMHFAHPIFEMCKAQQHMAIVEIPMPDGTKVAHWEVCGRKMPYTASIKSAHDIMDRVVAEYGHRALAAEKNQGVDWKALSHAVRIAQQAVELLDTGVVTFPRPNADHILAVKAGNLAYQLVAEEIDGLLIDVEAAAARSALPERADLEWVDSLVLRAHRDLILRAY
jgi:hypothetical protein